MKYHENERHPESEQAWEYLFSELGEAEASMLVFDRRRLCMADVDAIVAYLKSG